VPGSGAYRLTAAGLQALSEQENPLPEDPPRHPDAYEYGAPWGPDNPAPDSAWGTRPEHKMN
jgi:hypothetical protein